MKAINLAASVERTSVRIMYKIHLPKKKGELIAGKSNIGSISRKNGDATMKFITPPPKRKHDRNERTPTNLLLWVHRKCVLNPLFLSHGHSFAMYSLFTADTVTIKPSSTISNCSLQPEKKYTVFKFIFFFPVWRKIRRVHKKRP